MTPAVQIAHKAGIRFEVHTYNPPDDGIGYGDHAAAALGVERDRIFKTLVATLDTGALLVAVIPVAASLDLKALAALAGGKRAELAPLDRAERSTGYVAGGISPLGQRRRLPTLVDETAVRFATIHVSAGRRGLDLEIAPRDLIDLVRATVGRISTTKEV